MSIINLTKENFEAEVIKSDKPVLIDFAATWCGPCKMLSPVVDQIAEEHDEIKVCKIDIDEQLELAQQFRVMSVPTLIAFKDGKIIKQSVGVVPKSKILNMFQ